MSTVLSIAKTVVSNRSTSNGGKTGPQPLINDSAAADPASIGMAVLLANWTGQGQGDGLDYAGAAQDQLDFLFQNVPKTSDGAISHRTEQVQLWLVFSLTGECSVVVNTGYAIGVTSYTWSLPFWPTMA
jgi:hypothetical protein